MSNKFDELSTYELLELAAAAWMFFEAGLETLGNRNTKDILEETASRLRAEGFGNEAQRRGGQARAKKMTPEQRSDAARKAVRARIEKYNQAQNKS